MEPLLLSAAQKSGQQTRFQSFHEPLVGNEGEKRDWRLSSQILRQTTPHSDPVSPSGLMAAETCSHCKMMKTADRRPV